MNKNILISTAIAIFVIPATIFAADGHILTAQPGLSASQYAANVKSLSTRAEAKYEVAFSDQQLWGAAIANAEAASFKEPQNSGYVRTLAMLYAKTQWWSRSMTNFDRLESMTSLDGEARSTAAFVARKLGYLAMQRGNGQEAALYLQRSLVLEPNTSTQAMLNRVNLAYGF
jgi:tetratricopeptide (TPR) repeat protein